MGRRGKMQESSPIEVARCRLHREHHLSRRGSLVMSLNRFAALRRLLVAIKRLWYTRFWGMDLHPTCTFSLSAHFDLTHPNGVHVGECSYVAFGAAILSHDMVRGLRLHTRIG